MRKPPIGAWAHTALAVALAAATVRAAAPPPVGRLSILPEQPAYYVGQVARLQFEVELVDADLGGNLQLDGLPDAAWATMGPFAERPSETRTQDGRLVTVRRYASDLQLRAAGTFRVAPSLSGSYGERVVRGRLRLLTYAPFHIAFPPREIRVNELPTPAPDDFCGAIGRFRLHARTSPAYMSPGDLVTLHWGLEGRGNLDGFRPPPVGAPPGFLVYPAREEVREAGTRLAFTQVFIPESLESTELPALTMSVFDPELGRYQTLRAGPFPLSLRPRVEGAAAPVWTPGATVPGPVRERASAEWSLTAPAVTRTLLVQLGGLALAIVAFGAMAGRSRTRALACAVALLAAALLLARLLAAGERRHMVRLAEAAESRLGPSAQARTLATLPADATVRVLERTERWLRVEHDGASGWVPRSASGE